MDKIDPIFGSLLLTLLLSSAAWAFVALLGVA